MSAIEWLNKYPKESLIIKAYKFAAEAHKNTKRLDGSFFIEHPLAVAQKVEEFGLDETAIAAALLHDVIEDENRSLEEIKKQFGEEVAFLVDSLTKLKNIKFFHGKNLDKKIESENFRKFIIAFSKDLRVVLIKLADQYHNLKTLDALPPERQKKFALETLEIYAPLAHRLGIQKLSGELNDLAFKYAYPDQYQWLLKNIKEKYEERENYIKKYLSDFKKILNENKIYPLQVEARAKRYYSLYQKLKRYEMNLEKIYDLIAIRIIVKTIEECYLTLGVIHKYWAPLPNLIKDYIARPKTNGYRSLHTTVFFFENKITEIQIRTEEMHKESELGIAAHWLYSGLKHQKDYLKKWPVKNIEFEWVNQLREWQKHFPGSKEYFEAIKNDFLKENVFVLTPKNEIVELPQGATPVDFAYKIHTEIGNQCVGAKVNGKIVNLNYQLKSGDLVEILIQKNKKPSEEWLKFVKTSFALSQIKKALKQKNKKLKEKIKKSFTEINIIAEDRVGYLKDLTTIFKQMKINIEYLNSSVDKRKFLVGVILKCEVLPKNKLEKIILKIKEIKGTKEINAKIKNY